MVTIMMGLEGSGKTKQLIEAVNEGAKKESGSMVCIEKGSTLRYDVDHRARLIDASEYSIGGYDFLRGFLSGLHAGNFDISHIFIDNLYKVSQSKNPDELEAFLGWCDRFSETNFVNFTFTIAEDPAKAPESLKKYMA